MIAGPTTTRYLAAMGAEVIKVEAPGQGDPGRTSELHTVLGQAKKAIVLDLKKPEAVSVAKALAARADVVVENFATGVMDRLGLGVADLGAVNPGLMYVSASGLGRTGPEAHAVAYGTLLQCYAGFAGLNRHRGAPPRVGMAWLDPMCGLMLAFIVAAGIWRRRQDGQVARVDFSMIEAMLWTMAGPLLETQLSAPPEPRGNEGANCEPHGVWRCAGDDNWIAIAVTDDAAWRALCSMVPALSDLTGLRLEGRIEARCTIDAALRAWFSGRDPYATAAELVAVGVAAAAAAKSLDLVACGHLRERGFWDMHDDGVLPGLPWSASFGRASGSAPGLGADTEQVLATVLGLSATEIATLRQCRSVGVGRGPSDVDTAPGYQSPADFPTLFVQQGEAGAPALGRDRSGDDSAGAGCLKIRTEETFLPIIWRRLVADCFRRELLLRRLSGRLVSGGSIVRGLAGTGRDRATNHGETRPQDASPRGIHVILSFHTIPPRHNWPRSGGKPFASAAAIATPHRSKERHPQARTSGGMISRQHRGRESG